MKNVGIIDYGLGNLGSVRRAFEENDSDPSILTSAEQLLRCDIAILPGVGAFSEGMKNLRQKNWESAIKEFVDTGRPFIGICLGMQLLATKGEEGEVTAGLDLISGIVTKLHLKNFRVPHIGWNEVYWSSTNSVFEGIPTGTDFYFVHSFEFIPDQDSSILSRTSYERDFVSSVQKDNILGFQFHPEKSQRAGFRLIQNLLQKNLC